MTGDRETREPAGAHWVRFEPPLLLTGGGLDALIAESLPGARAVRVDFLDEGVVNSNYRVDLVWDEPGVERPETVKLRLSRSDEGPLREGALGRRLADRVTLPRLLGTALGREPEPHRRALFDWIPGRALAALPPEGIDLRPAARSLGRMLAALHDVHPGAFGRFAPDLAVIPPGGVPARRWTDAVSRRTAVRLDNPAHGLDPVRRDAVRTRFARLLAPLWTAPAAPPSIVHGDLSAGNVILAAGGGAPDLAGLVDWETARAGDPAEDVASLRFEIGARRPDFARGVEESWREARGGSGPDFERRVELASVPLLLDARMVAWRRRDGDGVARIDARLDAALAGGA